MNREIKITEIAENKNIEDYPNDTVFILDDHDLMAEDRFWDE